MLYGNQVSFRKTESWKALAQVDNLPESMGQLSKQSMLDRPISFTGIAFVPNVELQETADMLYLNLEVPGMEPEDFQVAVSEGVVFVRGDRSPRSMIHPRVTVHSEIRYGGFERLIPLPVRIQKNKAHAEYIKGILCIFLPKCEEDRSYPYSRGLINTPVHQSTWTTL
ncbi:MAG: Hsp20/alpha crystallin family protein [Leptolyngbyaceae cyanobacterium MO_188.B28]|nr:Hsp20/alpha crystallin family protein [Leptolyngbyaceae cyanobacterium MO_188.B28]